jgi:hypothetical protein
MGLEDHPIKVGEIFNRLTITKLYEVNKYGQNNTYADSICECGKKVDYLRLSTIKAGKNKSCGCYRDEMASKRMIEKNVDSHKLSKTRQYRIWAAMKTRCTNQNCAAYKSYGGRGIKICDDWMSSFVKFYDWAMSNGYCDKLSIDRIDVNGNYCPENCRWATGQEQSLNRRNTIYKQITAFGETKTLREWEEDVRCVVTSGVLAYRHGAGWDSERAITQTSERKSDAKGKYSLELGRYLEKRHPDILQEFLDQ